MNFSVSVLYHSCFYITVMLYMSYFCLSLLLFFPFFFFCNLGFQKRKKLRETWQYLQTLREPPEEVAIRQWAVMSPSHFENGVESVQNALHCACLFVCFVFPSLLLSAKGFPIIWSVDLDWGRWSIMNFIWTLHFPTALLHLLCPPDANNT